MMVRRANDSPLFYCSYIPSCSLSQSSSLRSCSSMRYKVAFYLSLFAAWRASMHCYLQKPMPISYSIVYSFGNSLFQGCFGFYFFQLLRLCSTLIYYVFCFQVYSFYSLIAQTKTSFCFKLYLSTLWKSFILCPRNTNFILSAARPSNAYILSFKVQTYSEGSISMVKIFRSKVFILSVSIAHL